MLEGLGFCLYRGRAIGDPRERTDEIGEDDPGVYC